MQAVALLCLLGTLVVFAAPQEKYSNRFDNINIDALLKSDRVVTQYVNCLTGKGSCTAEGREFRQHLPEALNTACSKCTNAQKTIIRKASKHLIANRPEDWAAIAKKFDPKGEKKTSFEAFLAGTN